jgi:PilZ domain-containing protein
MMPIVNSAAHHTDSAQTHTDRRRFPRTRTLKSGRVILTDRTTVDCTIRNLSRGGARLVFGAPTRIPAFFLLVVDGSKDMIPARLIWQKGLAAGVMFDVTQVGPR